MDLNADLVLEGGGTKGVALVGAVACLQEQHTFRRVAGTSVGALVAGVRSCRMVRSGAQRGDARSSLRRSSPNYRRAFRR